MSDITISGLHPKILDAFPQVQNEAKARFGVFVDIESGLRTPEQQAIEYAKGRDADGNIVDKSLVVTNAKPWSSWHNFGLAIDITPMNSKSQFYWWGDEDIRWKEIAGIAKIFGFSWGGDWSKFKGDLDHFEMKGKIQNIQEAKKILNKQGLDAVWALV